MATPLESSVVRIYTKSGKVVGAGFLVSSKYVLTCAHVVTDALGLARKTPEKPDLEIEISLDFPFLAAKQLFTAKVIFWRPENPDEQIEDIAGLELVNFPQNTAKPALLVASEGLLGHPFRVLGFPAGQPNGVSASGVLSGRTANGWVQLEDVKQPGYRLEPGFSGAPVWDEKLQGVVGIAVSADMKRPEVKAAFMIPTDVLIAAWPELGKQVIACPYRGLFAFREEDAQFFFGRETFTEQLFAAVQRQPLVAVIGSSGSGKSSVVLAGLIPKLRKEGSWLIESFRPNKQPFYELAAALISQLEPELGKIDKTIKAKELAESIRQHGFTADVSAIVKDNPGKRLLLVVDQFEELYTGCTATEQQQFVDALLAAVVSASRTITLVLTLRADFYSYVVNYPPFTEALNKYPAQNLSLMQAEEMQAAIERPAQEIRVELEKGLTQKILDDVKQEPGNLPLLEFALTQLWEKQSGGLLTHQAYAEIGGVAKALSNHAQAVYGKLSQGEQKQAQRIFLELVRLGEGTENTRQVGTPAVVGKDCWELIRRTDGLADARLVVTGWNEATGEETVEVVHEALIREWGLLRQWIDQNRKQRIQKQEIEDAARKWGDRGKAKDYLLGGKVLTEARVFQKQEAGHLTLSNLAKEFIQQSLRQRRIGRLKTASVLTIPLLITFIALLPEWKKANEQKAHDTIRTLGVGTLEALELLTEGCWERSQWEWIPDYLATPLFGKCANLRGANLSRASLSLANLIGAHLSSADLSRADLSRANLSYADLSGAHLKGAFLNYADLSGAHLSSADLSDADLSDAHLIGAHLSGANLSSANLSYAHLIGANLRGADLSSANLSSAFLRDAHLRGADLRGADLRGADLRDADLRGANLRGADLSSADLSSADLSSANLRGADLSSADLSSANLECREFKSQLFCTDFRGAKNLTPGQVKSARNWQKAIYDEEFRKKLGLK